MPTEKIYINDSLEEIGNPITEMGRLLRANYVYAAVFTEGHRPLWLDRHLHYAILSYTSLYGMIPLIDVPALATKISDLLARNRKPVIGNVVNIYLIPPDKAGGQPDVLIAHDNSTIYHGYTVRSIRPKAIIANYEIPFAGHRTAISLTTAAYMEQYAGREGAKTVLRANRTGELVSAGDFPIMAVIGGEAFTPPADSGVGESVEREIMVRSCGQAGIALTEKSIKVDDLPKIEEIMIFGTEGVVSVLSCSGYYFYNLFCDRIEQVLPQTAASGITKK